MTIYYAGLDLGTSRTSLATSTGARLTTQSCIGYPKDVIARKRLKGGDYLLGQEALKNRLALNMVWPLEHGVMKEDEGSIKATTLILRDILTQAIPDKKGSDQIYAAIGVPAQASIKNKKTLIDLCSSLVNKVLIVSEPFAVAYGMDRFDECMVVDIGGGTVDACRIHGSLPEEGDQITLTTAGNFLDGKITEAILGQYPGVQLTPQIIQRIKEKYGYVGISEKVIVKLTEKGIPGEYDLTGLLQDCCLQLTNPICKAVQTLISTFDADFQELLRNNVIIAGGGSRLRGIDRAIEKGLEAYGGGNVECTQDPEFGGAIGALKMSLEMPEEYWAQI